MNRFILWLLLLLIPYQRINVCVADSAETGKWMMKDGVNYRVGAEMLDKKPTIQINRAFGSNVKMQKKKKVKKILVVRNTKMIEVDDYNNNPGQLAAFPKPKAKKLKCRKNRGGVNRKRKRKSHSKRVLTTGDGLCGTGKKQSPINFDPASLVIVRMNNTFKMNIINYNNFTAIPSLITMTNTGYTVKVLLLFDDERKIPYIGGRLLSEAIFHFKEIIFHWGADLS